MKRAGEEGKKMEGDPNARREAGKLHDVIILIVMTVSFLINSSFSRHLPRYRCKEATG